MDNAMLKSSASLGWHINIFVLVLSGRTWPNLAMCLWENIARFPPDDNFQDQTFCETEPLFLCDQTANRERLTIWLVIWFFDEVYFISHFDPVLTEKMSHNPQRISLSHFKVQFYQGVNSLVLPTTLLQIKFLWNTNLIWKWYLSSKPNWADVAWCQLYQIGDRLWSS